MSDAVLKINDLGRKFGKQWAVHNMNLDVPKGSVFGLLGPNGAGKSTTINMTMGMLPPTSGMISLMGYNPVINSVKIRQRVGYVPEIYGFYEWMTVDDTINLVSAYHSTWNWSLCNTLKSEFKLPGEQKTGALSKGTRAKLALLLALSFDPEMLVLDEPTGGLDPAARRNFIESILGHYHEDGKTILISSHLLNEFAGLLDYVAFIKEGHVELVSKLEDLHDHMKRARLIFAEKVPDNLKLENVLPARKNGREALVVCKDFTPEKTQNDLLQSSGAENVIIEEMSLEDIFVELVGS